MQPMHPDRWLPASDQPILPERDHRPVSPAGAADSSPDAPSSDPGATPTVPDADAPSEDDNHLVYSTRTPNGFPFLARHQIDGRPGTIGVDPLHGRRRVDLDEDDPTQHVVDLSLVIRGLALATSVAGELESIEADEPTRRRAAASFDVSYDLIARGVSAPLADELSIFVTAFGGRIPSAGEVTSAHGRLVSWAQTVASQVQSTLEAEAAALAAREAAAQAAAQGPGLFPLMLRPLPTPPGS